jgi:hypothetical protein
VNVQELIDKLQQVKDKSLPAMFDRDACYSIREGDMSISDITITETEVTLW